MDVNGKQINYRREDPDASINWEQQSYLGQRPQNPDDAFGNDTKGGHDVDHTVYGNLGTYDPHSAEYTGPPQPDISQQYTQVYTSDGHPINVLLPDDVQTSDDPSGMYAPESNADTYTADLQLPKPKKGKKKSACGLSKEDTQTLNTLIGKMPKGAVKTDFRSLAKTGVPSENRWAGRSTGGGPSLESLQSQIDEIRAGLVTVGSGGRGA